MGDDFKKVFMIVITIHRDGTTIREVFNTIRALLQTINIYIMGDVSKYIVSASSAPLFGTRTHKL